MATRSSLWDNDHLVWIGSLAFALTLVGGPSLAQDVDGAEPTVEGAPADSAPAQESPPPAPAEDAPATEEAPTGLVIGELRTGTRFQAGVNLRTDLGAHPLRLDAALRMGDVDLIAVIDPMALGDGQFDGDLLVGWRPFGFPWGALVGWRTTAIGLQGGTQMQQRLLLGATADLPSIFDAIRASWGLEMAAVLVRHGGGLPTETIGFSSGRHYIDYLNFGMFLRIHFEALVGEE